MVSELPALFGYDPDLLERLAPRRRRAIGLLVEAWILSSAALACSVGYALWLVEHSAGLSLLATFAMAMVVINLLRLVVAGSGAAPHLGIEHVKDYRPALGPTFVLSMLAALLAQPGQLPLWQSELAAPLAEHRAELLNQQAELAHSLGQAPTPAFRAELESSDFLAWRVREIWKDPQRAFLLSVLYWFLVLSPTLAGRFVALGALREYELVRWHAVRGEIEAAGRAAARDIARELSPYPTYEHRPHPTLTSPLSPNVPFLARPTRQRSTSRWSAFARRLRLPWRSR
ncbi:MAG: hypothetical protein QM778_14895 [Myxococcales bacterium]